MNYLLDDVVDYNIGLLTGKAIVKGIATVAMPIIGKNYILEDLSKNFPNNDYPYSHFVCFECHMKLATENNKLPYTCNISEQQWGVHKTHCCIKHGCKYGDVDCPVELGLIKQDGPCEDCFTYEH